MPENVVEQKEADAHEHAQKDVAGDVAAAEMQVGKGQGEHHHHEATEGVEDFAPELDFVALRALPVGFEVRDVAEQLKGLHALRIEQRGGDDIC